MVPASAKGVLQNMVGSPNPTPLEEWPCLMPDRKRGPTSAEALLKQTGIGVTALGCLRFGPVSLGYASVSTTRLYDRHRSRPKDSPTFRVAY